MEHLRNFLLRQDNIGIYSAVLTFLALPQKDLIDEIVLQCSSEIQAEMAEKLGEAYQLYKNNRTAYENEYRFGQAVIWQEVLSAYKKISNAKIKIQAITLCPDTSNYAQSSKEIYKLLCIYSEMQIALSNLEQVLGVDRFLDRVSGSTFDVLNEMMGNAKKTIEAKALGYKNAFQETWNTTNINKLIRHKLLAPNTENQVCDLSTSNSKQVLLFVIDGFGFSQYLWNRSFDSNRTNFTFNENIFSWLSRNNLSKENILGSSYVTDTGAGLAQIYLGQKPGETGIVASKIRKRNDFTNFYATKSVSPNEFDALFSYKNSITDLVVLGGFASKIYYCSKYQDPPSGFSKCIFKSADIVPILPPERVFSVLMDDIEENAEGGLQVVYLTGIDNSGHTMGAYSNFERFEHQKIGYLFRNFLIELANNYPDLFDGKRSVIITADHGMFESSKIIVNRKELSDHLFGAGIKRVKFVENNRAMLVYNEGYSSNNEIKTALQEFFNMKQLQVDIQDETSVAFSTCLDGCNEDIKPDLIMRFTGEGLFYTSVQVNEHLLHFGGHGGNSVDEVFVPLIEIPLSKELLTGIQKRFISRK